jgi:hypothetical protein
MLRMHTGGGCQESGCIPSLLHRACSRDYMRTVAQVQAAGQCAWQKEGAGAWWLGACPDTLTFPAPQMQLAGRGPLPLPPPPLPAPTFKAARIARCSPLATHWW